MDMIKCISLHQPWASLCVLPSLANPDEAVKPYETRHWPTNYRGTLLIHAAKKWNGELIAVTKSEPFHSQIARLPSNREFDHAFCMPLGCIVGAVEMVKCFEVAEMVIASKRILELVPAERYYGYGHDILPMPTGDALAFGDFSIGRYAWRLAKPRMFKKPIPYKGAQGFFNVPAALVSEELEGRGR